MVLEAKLVTPDGFAIPLFTEFVENTGNNSKQDCELKAFYRMAEKIKANFPRLPILLTIDGLFACGPVFEVCKEHGWKCMVVLKDGSLPTVNQEFRSLLPLQPENRLTFRCSNGKLRVEQRLQWIDDIGYSDTRDRGHIVDVIECAESQEDTHGVVSKTTYRWVTNMKVSHRNVVKLANEGGRIRWKVENEGFNVQKNGGYGLEHAYTSNSTSAKIFYFLLQIAHMVAQLLDRGNLLRNLIPAGFGSHRNLAFRLLEAWRNARMTAADMQALLARRFQIRLDDSS